MSDQSFWMVFAAVVLASVAGKIATMLLDGIVWIKDQIVEMREIMHERRCKSKSRRS